jgi:hypothetical protein
MPVIKQLSIFLENKPGVLRRLSDSLAEAEVNVLGITVVDTVDHAVVRLLLSDPDKAQFVLEQHHALVVASDVLALEVPNEVGALAKLAETLTEANVNIEYAYGTTSSKGNGSTLVLRVDRMEKACEALGVPYGPKA